LPDYFEYYDSAIQQGSNGLKLVLGGTGLGKTRGIRAVLSESRSLDDSRKFIYVANRIQLLNEMYQDLVDKDGFLGEEIVHLERNRDTVKNALSTTSKHRFYKLLRSRSVREIADRQRLDVIAIERMSQQVENLITLLDDKQQVSVVNQMMEQTIESYTSTVKHFFKQLLTFADNSVKSDLLDHPTIRELFPFITFQRNPRAKILLVTIHKGFLGFFDGDKNINLMNLRNNIIFLDEFDFLEPDLTELICRSPQVSDPFLFVDMFYRAMTRHKLPLDTYPMLPGASGNVEKIRGKINRIVEKVDDLSRDKNIHFPDINQFTTQIEKRQASIFQTNRMILRTPLFLRETGRSFEIVEDRGEGTIPALDLFNTVQWATAQILYLFADIKGVSNQMYEEMLQHCFPQSYLADQVENTAQFPQPYRKQYTRLGNLLSSGFGLYEIQDLRQVTDEDEVKFRHYAIHTTPERVILAIAEKNLVFGLSATADLTRFVKHFNIPWLKKQLNETDGAKYFEVEESDEQIIQLLNLDKLGKRKNDLKVDLTIPIEDLHGGKELQEYISQIAEHFIEFGGNDRSGYRRKRVENFFSTLIWLLDNRNAEELQQDSHLLFFNSFKQIKFILSDPVCHEGTDLFNVEPIQLGNNKHMSAYKLSLGGQPFNIVFYDAQYAREIQNEEEVKAAYYELFWQGVPVIVVTQYASAGNGINLQYYASPSAKQQNIETDFRNVHLLDVPFFFFDRIQISDQTFQEIVTSIKKNLWYAAKLYEGKIISAGKFFNLLENLRSYDFNQEYNRSSNQALSADALKNRMSIYIQALGRVERVWTNVLTQTVFMTLEVFDDFAIYSTDDAYAGQRETRVPRISNNLSKVWNEIRELTRSRQKYARRVVDEGLAARNAKCETLIRNLLLQIAAVRSGKLSDEECVQVRRTWSRLREAALQHDFANPLLEEYKATFTSSYFQNGILYIGDNYKLYPPSKRPPETLRWRLDVIYDIIKENSSLSNFFLNSSRSYELEFSTATETFFTPYFYQAILAGAIGEVSIEYLLDQCDISLDSEIPNTLFELADLKVNGVPWYIDCKNYSERTMARFSLPKDDPAYHDTLSEAGFEMKTKLKLKNIRKYHEDEKENCKFIYLNLTSTDERKIRYIHSSDFNSDVSFSDANIIVVQGIIDPNSPNQYTSGFEQFIADCRTHLLRKINDQ
jgi:hypothetical protein